MSHFSWQGPLFLIIIMVVMGMMGGAAVHQMSLVIYLMLPIGSLIFIILIDMISIKSEADRAVYPGTGTFRNILMSGSENRQGRRNSSKGSSIMTG